eukprot:gene19351-26407_t
MPTIVAQRKRNRNNVGIDSPSGSRSQDRKKREQDARPGQGCPIGAHGLTLAPYLSIGHETVANRPMTDTIFNLAPTPGERAKAALGRRNLVLVGLMGAGKSAIGRLVAQQLGLPFIDTDTEIERVSRMTISELFAAYGEDEFRALETRVIKRLMRSGPRVVSTGGG